MPLITVPTPNWKKRRTVSYRDTNGKAHNAVQTQAPSSGVATLKIFEYNGTTARVLANISTATARKGANSTGKYHLR
jgi:hypothetical protein